MLSCAIVDRGSASAQYVLFQMKEVVENSGKQPAVVSFDLINNDSNSNSNNNNNNVQLFLPVLKYTKSIILPAALLRSGYCLKQTNCLPVRLSLWALILHQSNNHCLVPLFLVSLHQVVGFARLDLRPRRRAS